MTKQELAEMDDLDFTLIILRNKLKGCFNPNSSLGRKLQSAIITIQIIRNKRGKQNGTVI